MELFQRMKNPISKAVILLLFTILTTTPAWAQLSGSGTAEDPYLITSDADWITFCDLNVHHHAFTLENADHFRLTADITATKYRSLDFAGEFDGNGHTITISYGTNKWPGLFYASAACLYIHDLKVQGTIFPAYSTAHNYGGAIICRILGSPTKVIENCIVSVDIRNNSSNTNTVIGGFVGECSQFETEDYDEGLTLRNCIFNGTTPRTGGHFNAGFVGYSNNESNYSALHLENCVYTPREVLVEPNYTFCPQYSSAEGIYYTSNATHNQGSRVYDNLPGGDVYAVIAVPFKNTFNYYYLPQNTVSYSGLEDSYPYTGSPVTISYTVINNGATLNTGDYTAVIKNAVGETVTTVTDKGDYQLQVTIGDVTYSHAFYVSGPLTQVEGVYQINSLADWMTLADDVAAGNSYSGATLRLNTNFTTDVMIGTESHKFSGNFDGNGHTIIFNKTATEDFCAPFRYIENATISNLTITGFATSTGKKMGGLVAYACGTNTISHCSVGATLTCNRTDDSDASNGGFVAHVENDGGSTTLTYCTFNGFLYGTKALCNGGFVGWGGTTINLDHCLFNPIEMNMGSTESSTFARCETVNYNHAYYLRTFGATQGVKAYTSAQNALCDKQTMGDGNDYYILRSSSIEDLAVTYEYADGSSISLGAYYVLYDGSTLDPSKYTVTIRNSSNTVVSVPAEVGRYKMTVSGDNSEGYYGSISKNFWVMRTLPTNEDGFALVGDMTDWNSLACLMESSRDIAGIKVKLTADIGTEEAPIRKMISDAETYAFNGIFDGNGHTLTINLWDKGPVGPFRYVGNATFVNTHVTGRIRGKDVWDSYLGGLVGKAAGIVNITACHSSVLMWDTGLGYAGGFIGSDRWSYANITITDCLFDGTYKNNIGATGGFMGHVGYATHFTITNCLNNSSLINNGGQIIIVNPILGESYNPSSYTTISNCWHKFETEPADCNSFRDQGDGYTDKTGTELREQMGSGWTINSSGEVVPAMVTSYSRSIAVADGIIHGTVTAPTSCISSGIVNLTVTPDENYSVVSVTYNDGSIHNVTMNNGVYSFTMPNANVTVSATFSLDPNAIPYMAYNTTTDRLEQCMHVSPTVVTESSTTLGTADNESWYIVNRDVTVEGRMTVNGTVNLILADNATLTSVAGITVHSGNTLNIYGQVEGTGAIVATVVEAGGNYAAIGTEDNGGNNPKTLGTINIHGGHITATGGAWSAGIGGGVGGGSGTINIYGGTISAIGNNGDAQAIGRGSSGYPVTRSLVDGLCVYRNNNSTPDGYNNRIGGLDQQIVRVEPCTEHNFVNNVCTYCGHYHHYELSYNANGATGGEVPPTAIILCDGDRIATVSDNVGELDRVGYTFAGWNTAADGSGTAYMPGDEFTISEMVTLYAQWNVITYLIGYSLDGGTLPEGQSNPVHYTIESGDITLVNPTKTGCFFLGWSGTGIQGTSKSVTIPAGSSGHRSYTVTWDDNTPPFAGMEIDPDFHDNPDQVGRYFVKMPAPEKPTGVWVYNEELDDYVEVMDPADEDFPVRIDTIPDWFNTSFKVYDSGGKEDYFYNTNDSHINTLILIAPEGKIFSVQGEPNDISIDNYQSLDRLAIYDGATTTDPILVNIDEEREQFDGMPFATTGNIIRFDLYTDAPDTHGNGLSLTVTVTTPPVDLTLANDDSQSAQTNIGLIASNQGTFANVTLEGRTLYRDGTWNTLCLPFDIEDIHSSLLRGATVKTLESTDFADGTLTMNFADASSIEAGKPYLLKWDINLSYNVIEGTDGIYYNYYSPGNLFDGYPDPESSWSPVENDGAYCIFEASEGTMAVTGYTITTGYSNPQAWTLEGKRNEGDPWTLIDNRDATTTPSDALPNSNGTDQYYSAANPGTYHYFRFTVTKGGEEDEFGNSGFSLSELTLQGDFTPLNLVNPTFNYVTIKNELHPMTSNGVTFAGYYGTMATTGLLFDEHNLFGNALHANLSITDPEPIPGCSFNAWCEDAELTTPASTIPFDSATGNVNLYARYGLFVDVAGYGDSDTGWVFIASPVTNSLKPKEVGNLLGTRISEAPVLYDYDLYRFNQSGDNNEWENYEQHTDLKDPANPFRIENGQGYLYARQSDVSLYFAGALNTANTKTVPLTYESGVEFAGWNLVGNPFIEAAKIDRTYYKMNATGDDIEAVGNYTENTIPAFTGVMVKAESTEVNPTVTFTRASYATSTGNHGDLAIALSQQTEASRDGSSTTVTHDKAFVSFNQGSQLGKFVFNRYRSKLYIPQGRKDYSIAFSEKSGEMPVNFEASENGTYTITVSPEGVEMNYLHLIDNLTGANVDLLTQPSYTFDARVSDYTSRFKLVYSARKSIEEIGDNEPFAFIHNGEIIIESDGIVQVIDMLGHIIVCRDAMHCVSTAGMVPGVYVLRLINEENVRTQKIVVR